MSGPEQKVQNLSLGLPQEGMPRDKRRYRVKRRIDGRDKTRSLETKAEVPLAPELVARLRSHMERWPPVDGHVFTNAAGRTPTTTIYGPVWVRARTVLWPRGHRLGKITVYDFRHSAATMTLRAGVAPAEVARRLGHSVDILMRVYAGVFDDERQRSNELIDHAIREQTNSRMRPSLSA